MSGFTETLAKVKKHGYWRVVTHPADAPHELIPTLPEAQHLLTRSAVSLTRWDYPHVPQVKNDNNRIYPLDDRIEAWTDFELHKEILRLYNNGLFVHLMAIPEDWFAEDNWLPPDHHFRQIKPGTLMDFLGVIYQVTQILIFVRNLVQAELYPNGLVLRLELHGTENRQLTTFDLRRASFGTYVSHGKVIRLRHTYTAMEILEGYLKIAEEHILQIFHRFDWQRAAPALIQEEQRRLLERRL